MELFFIDPHTHTPRYADRHTCRERSDRVHVKRTEIGIGPKQTCTHKFIAQCNEKFNTWTQARMYITLIWCHVSANLQYMQYYMVSQYSHAPTIMHVYVKNRTSVHTVHIYTRARSHTYTGEPVEMNKVERTHELANRFDRPHQSMECTVIDDEVDTNSNADTNNNFISLFFFGIDCIFFFPITLARWVIENVSHRPPGYSTMSHKNRVPFFSEFFLPIFPLHNLNNFVHNHTHTLSLSSISVIVNSSYDFFFFCCTVCLCLLSVEFTQILSSGFLDFVSDLGASRFLIIARSPS